MQTRSFSIGEMIKFGWQKLKEQPITWITSVILFTLIMGSHPFINNWLLGDDFNLNDEQEHLSYSNHIALGVIAFLYILIDTGLSLGLTYMGLRAADNLPINPMHLFARFQYVFHYLIASFLYGLMIIGGLILFLFPAAVWASKFSLFPYFIVDRGSGPIESLKLSSQATDGAKWDIFGFLVTLFFLLILSMLVVLLGLFVTLPIMFIAWGKIYRLLTTSTQVEIPAVTTIPSSERTV